MIQENQLSPNIQTFGALAYKIGFKKDLETFFLDLKVNFQILRIIKVKNKKK